MDASYRRDIAKPPLQVAMCQTILIFLLPLIGCSASQQHAQQEVKLRAALAYLIDIPEVSWFEVVGNNVYVGFNSKSDDLSLIIRGAAVKGNKAIQFGVHVWAVPANNRGWRPGKGPFYEEVTARNGKIQR